ncbi:hypothetical protein ILFOPFJJ_05153 [Ensifer psoraleae]|nr:hypothetical protein [Sinorhizobium psoraleae]
MCDGLVPRRAAISARLWRGGVQGLAARRVTGRAIDRRFPWKKTQDAHAQILTTELFAIRNLY